MTFWTWTALVAATGCAVYAWMVADSNRKELARKLRVLLTELVKAEASLDACTSHVGGYFDHHKKERWKNQYRQLFALATDSPFHSSILTLPEKDTFRSFLDHYIRVEAIRDAFNKAFVPEELRRFDQFFSHIEGRSLDVQQRTAIVRNEDSSLIVAGAGSGKTTTIVGKVAYLVERYGAQPGNILLISFTNKSAAQLQARLGTEGVVPRTFHKFGKDVICAVEGKQPSLYDESQFPHFLRSSFGELMKDPAYAQLVTTYFRYDLKPAKNPASFQSQGEYIQHLKDNNFRTYKQVAKTFRGKTTLKNEVVKSVEEYHIANFLFVHGVEYQYEAPYEHATASAQHAQWKPDFTITHGDQRVYLEHFGIDREGKVPAFFNKPGRPAGEAGAVYWRKINFARETSQRLGTVLLESYSYEMSENTLFTNLAENLRLLGIPLRPKTPEEVWDIIANAAKDDVQSFHTLLQTFITLMKSNNYSVEQVRAQAAQGADERQRQRNIRFLDIVLPLHARYQQELGKRKEIDFSDLINTAAAYIQRGAYRQRLDYLIIDEFQDISMGRYGLVQALTTQNPHCKLFCVGDDWQSIYRFAGSDIALFKKFGQYFGFSITSKIETTYRFHEPLISRTSAFITRNPNQTPKTLRSIAPHKQTRHQIVYGDSYDQDDTAVLQQVLDGLVAEGVDIGKKEVLLLGRYTFDKDRVRNHDRVFGFDAATSTFSYPYRDPQGQRATLLVPFLTVHRSKGLEADIVIVLNCNAGKFGFPSEMSDDPVLSLVLSDADQFENGEERRLFYVALTRAKERVILVADRAHKSKFITELEASNSEESQKKCPLCITADAVLRTGTKKNGDPWAFYGCSNHLYGCEYQEWVRLAPAIPPQM